MTRRTESHPSPDICRGFFQLLLALLLVSSKLSAVTWNVDAAGNWTNDANWSASHPDGTDTTATFGNIITANRTITLDTDLTVGTLEIDDGNNYRLSSNSLTFDVSAGTASFTVTNANGDGAHTLASDVVLMDDLVVNTASTGQLTISGLISDGGSDYGLTKQGSGTLALSAINTYEGDTIISGGTLLLSFPNRIDDNSLINLSGGTFDTNSKNEFQQSVTLSDDSTLKLSGSSSHFIRFGNITSWDASKTLVIEDWTGTVGNSSPSTDTDRIIFSTDPRLNANFLSALNNDRILFADGGAATVTQDGSIYYLHPTIPETSTWITLAGLLTLSLMQQIGRVGRPRPTAFWRQPEPFRPKGAAALYWLFRPLAEMRAAQRSAPTLTTAKSTTSKPSRDRSSHRHT